MVIAILKGVCADTPKQQQQKGRRMSKELEALEKFLDDYLTLCEKLHTNRQEKMLLDKNSPYNVLKQGLLKSKKELEALEIIKPYLRLSDNWLQTKVNTFNIDNLWEYVKEITDEEQLNLLKDVLE